MRGFRRFAVLDFGHWRVLGVRGCGVRALVGSQGSKDLGLGVHRFWRLGVWNVELLQLCESEN